MNIRELANQINDACWEYKIGELQEIRKELKGLDRRPGSKIFSDATINDDGWAFHHGGRKEIQFNIGFEDDGLRYGLAFSLEPSQSLPDVSVLYPKILKLNCLIREKPELFHNYKLWYWDGERSETMEMGEIPSGIIQSNAFIFFGKLVDENQIKIDDILTEFDNMLPIYISVESDEDLAMEFNDVLDDGFVFNRQERNLTRSRAYNSVEIETQIEIRHSLIQLHLQQYLENKYGSDNVSIENPHRGNRIDAVVKHNNAVIFYEIKTSSTAKACIRQAIGQLLEYSYWNGNAFATNIVVVGEHRLCEEGVKYISKLREGLNIPLEYLQIDLTH